MVGIVDSIEDFIGSIFSGASVEILEELKSRAFKIFLVFLPIFGLFFMFELNFYNFYFKGVELKIPYIFPNLRHSLSIQAYNFLRESLLPKTVETIVLSPTDAISAVVWVAFLLTLIIIIPYIFYQILSFLLPALYKEEKSMVKKSLIPTSVLFFVGVLFAYKIVLPVAFHFLYLWADSIGAMGRITPSSFMNFVMMVMITMGISFQLPVLMGGLSRFGVVDYEWWKEHVPHAVVIIAILSSLLSSPDIITMLLYSVPLWGLYFGGLVISKYIS